MTLPLTPLLNDLVVSVAAPAILIADPDGQVRSGGVTGWYVDDVRLLDEVVVSVEGSDLEPVGSTTTGADRQLFTHVARHLGGWIHDPQVTLDRRRTLSATGLVEEIVVDSRAQQPVELVLHVDLAADLAPMAEVRQGHRTEHVAGERTDAGLAWDGFAIALDPAPDDVDDGRRVTWRTTLEPGTSRTVTLTCTADATAAFGPGGSPPWSADTRVEAADIRLTRLVEQSLADLYGLLLRDGDDAFLAAGSPWFLTLFGRDSLWCARLLMPFGTDLALSTLRTLARRQGETTDPASEEQPGKILHEVRNTTLELGGMSLPPVYYGTVDATPLFVCTLADAWQWGADRDEVAALLPAVRRCLAWVMEQSSESGWLRYVDVSGRGLANQGWKDSVDSVQHADGRLAQAPIALCEVQGYAYEAAVRGAALLAAFDEPEVDGLAAWAADLRTRFQDAFWVETPEGGHVAIALDREGRQVDSVTSNIGHLLGTGILTEEQVARCVEVLAGPDAEQRVRPADADVGLAALQPAELTTAARCGRTTPRSPYAVSRSRAGSPRPPSWRPASSRRRRASARLPIGCPSCIGGDAAADRERPVDYPASCRPQAWAAAAPLACLVAATGLEVDRDGLTHPVRVSTRLAPFTVHGVRAGGARLSLDVAGDGTVSVSTAGE